MVYAQRRSSSKEQLWKGTPVPITVLRDVVLKFLSAKQGLTQRDFAPWDKSEVCLRYIRNTKRKELTINEEQQKGIST